MNKCKLIAIYVVLMLIFASSVFGTSFDFYRDDGTAGTTFDVGYEGSIRNMENNVVENKNFACEIECTFTTDQGKSGTVPGVSGGTIPPGYKKSPPFSIPVIAQGSKVTTTVTCVDSGSWPCDGSKTISKDVSIRYDYCGDGITQADHETCDGGSKICSQLNSKYYSTKSASCKSDCSGYNINVCEYCGDGTRNGAESCDNGALNGNKCNPSYGSTCSYCDSYCKTQTLTGAYCGDGNKDSSENCANCEQDAGCGSNQACSNSGECITLGTDQNCAFIGNRCSSSEECENKVCKSKCGNKKRDSGENCLTCSIDVKCASNEACSNSGICIGLGTNENCASIGDRCVNSFCLNKKCVECRNSDDCKSKTQLEPTGEYKCSSDYLFRIPIMSKKGGECKNYVCTGSIRQDGSPESCNGKPCHDIGNNNAQCGCFSGFSEYQNQCLEIKELKFNTPCKTDFQCEDGLCDNGLCAKGLILNLNSKKNKLDIGEETEVILSVSNPLKKDVYADLVVDVGSGLSISSGADSDICSGNQCKSQKVLIPANQNKEISFGVEGKSATNVDLKATVTYDYGEREPITIEDISKIAISDCGNGKVEEGETSDTCCIDAGCPKDTQAYSFTCNQKTNSCKKSLHSYYLYGGIGGLVVLLLLIYGIAKSVSHYKKNAPEREKRRKEKELEKKKKQEEKEKRRKEEVLEKQKKKAEKKAKEEKKKKKPEKKEKSEKKTEEKKEEEKESKGKKSKFCHKCGGKLKSNIKFCNKCGAKVK